MIRRLSTAAAVLFAIFLAAPNVGRAQTFKVEKFDIKGDGGTDYVAVESATGRVFVSRQTHMMVVEGATGKVLGDIPNTPGVHGAGIATKAGHGFTTNGGDSTVTMFDLKTLEVIKQIKVEQGGLDGIMFDEPDDKIILTNHSRPIGTLTALNPQTGDIVGTAELEDTAPEGDSHHCRVRVARWDDRPGGLVFVIEANRFLHHMVRFLVGTMLDVGPHGPEALPAGHPMAGHHDVYQWLTVLQEYLVLGLMDKR